MRSGILLAALAVLVTGCSGESEGRVAVHKVTGKVTLAGGGLGGATVSFAPTDDQPVAIGKTADDGTFVLTTYDYGDGAAEGKYDVLISKSVANAAPADAAGGHDAMAASGAASPSHGGGKNSGPEDQSLVNPKYSKAGLLNATVTTSGPNEFDFSLEP